MKHKVFEKTPTNKFEPHSSCADLENDSELFIKDFGYIVSPRIHALLVNDHTMNCDDLT